MRKIFISLSVILLLTVCDRSKNPIQVNTLEINPADSVKTGFSDFFELEDYIMLETSSSSMMNSIRKIYIANDKIFILTWGDAQVLVFDINGKFINKVGTYGRGPDEYTYVVDFSVSPSGDTICLFDKGLEKAFYYNSQGNLLLAKKLSADLETFLTLPDGNIVGYSFLNNMAPLNDTIYQLWYFNRAGEIIDGCLPVRKDVLGMSIGLASSFNSTTSGHFFIPYTQNIVYKISQNPFKITPLYRIDFKDRSMPENILDIPRKEMYEAFNKAFILSGEYIGTKDLLLNIYCYEQDKSLVAIYNLNKQDYILLNSNNLFDNANELPIRVRTQNTFYGKDRLIAILNPLDLLNHDYENSQSLGFNLKQKVKETDNPILVIYKEK